MIGGGDEPVRHIPVPGRQDDLGVAAGQCQPGLADVIVAPPQLVPEGITVEAQAASRSGTGMVTASTIWNKGVVDKPRVSWTSRSL